MSSRPSTITSASKRNASANHNDKQSGSRQGPEQTYPASTVFPLATQPFYVNDSLSHSRIECGVNAGVNEKST